MLNVEQTLEEKIKHSSKPAATMPDIAKKIKTNDVLRVDIVATNLKLLSRST